MLIVARVSLGRPYTTSAALHCRRPPCARGAACGSDVCAHARPHDSVIAEAAGTRLFREFVVFERGQTYPEYVVTLDRV